MEKLGGSGWLGGRRRLGRGWLGRFRLPERTLGKVTRNDASTRWEGRWCPQMALGRDGSGLIGGPKQGGVWAVGGRGQSQAEGEEEV